jgi:hypothetical protein
MTLTTASISSSPINGRFMGINCSASKQQQNSVYEFRISIYLCVL